MNEEQIIEQLTRETPATPTVDVPCLETIEGIARRRSEVRHQLLAVGCLLIGAAFVGVISRRSNDVVARSNSSALEARGAKGVISTPPVKSLAPLESPTVAQSNAVEVTGESLSQSENDVRVYATVVEAVPVFQFEAGSQVYRHLGWLDQQRVVPVDLSDLPADQQQSFEAVLKENSQPTYYNL